MPYALIPVTPFQQNCTLIWCPESRRASIIDPGGEAERIQRYLQDLELIPESILLTHGHLDHAGGAMSLSERCDIPIIGPHRDDEFLLSNMEQQAAMFGFGETRPCVPERWLSQGDEVRVGEQTLEVLHCPGHTPGHIVFFLRAEKLAQVGDVLFRGSVGRSDFPRGDHGTLIRSIRERLWPLGNDVRFIPGHGPESTFGEERRSNPFVADGH
ncbi:MAG: MBL fold metallo-hydrolase [Candidatus Thiodiazotropha sp.]|jgi:hydroxyacylglutathione hydrolase